MSQSDVNMNNQGITRKVRYRGRLFQLPIYLGKLLRTFVYESDWKVLPMSAVIAALVSLVVRKDFFLTMEGTLKGAFALTCVSIWNGCFNSIQSICRERNIIKREHRSGMHISSYICAHMIYQALICVMQSIITLIVCRFSGVQFPQEGVVTHFLMAELGITIFLITFASDMLSLLVSSFAHSTTTAMTVMPFVLIFQLVFSGGMFNLPTWANSFSDFTLSKFGTIAISAQAHYNDLPMVTGWTVISKLKSERVGAVFTVGEVVDALTQNEEILANSDEVVIPEVTLGDILHLLETDEVIVKNQDEAVITATTVGNLLDFLKTSPELENFRQTGIAGVTVGSLIDQIADTDVIAKYRDYELNREVTLGEIVHLITENPVLVANSGRVLVDRLTFGEILDAIENDELIRENWNRELGGYTTVGDIIDRIGENNVKSFIEQRTSEVSRNTLYESTKENVADCWAQLALYALLYALIAMINLEFIDKDKR